MEHVHATLLRGLVVATLLHGQFGSAQIFNTELSRRNGNQRCTTLILRSITFPFSIYSDIITV